MVFEFSLVELTEPKFALLSTYFLQRAILLSQNMGVLIANSIVIELIQNALFDHFLKIGVELRRDLLVQPDPTAELQIIF